jgi:hypothetical protein
VRAINKLLDIQDRLQFSVDNMDIMWKMFCLHIEGCLTQQTVYLIGAECTSDPFHMPPLMAKFAILTVHECEIAEVGIAVRRRVEVCSQIKLDVV